jgi:hypothetical protein
LRVTILAFARRNWRKQQKICQDNRCPARDPNPGPPEYKSGKLPLYLAKSDKQFGQNDFGYSYQIKCTIKCIFLPAKSEYIPT